ncbi:MAG: ACT domain-containing protein [Synechococcales cyanobacterium]
MPSISDLTLLLRHLNPVLQEGAYAFVSVRDPDWLKDVEILAFMREPEGFSAVIPLAAAEQRGIPILFRAAWIMLTVSSDLAAVGLTAAVAQALAQAGLSCNVVAGSHHDHLFVPLTEAERAMSVLRALQHPNDSVSQSAHPI